MAIKHIEMERFSVTSAKSFDEVMAVIDVGIGHPDLVELRRRLGSATYAEMEKIIDGVIGPSSLMEFIRFDLGGIVRKERGEDTPRILRLVAGNPIIMKQMVERVPDAGSYAPVTILIDERPEGVHLSYDTMASLLAPYKNSEALKVAQDLDEKVKALLTAAAG
jgi:uncharacterized protein (DUF302 family)